MFFGWKTLYLFVMKLVFISLTGYTIYLMKVPPCRLSSKSPSVSASTAKLTLSHITTSTEALCLPPS
jgi:hypothetical protein